MPRAVRNRQRVSNTVNPASMELGQLLASPRQSLVLLTSAQHQMTTGSKARLAEQIHAFEHAIPPPAGTTNLTPPPLPVTVNEDPLTANAFSEVQITQLRSLISAAVHIECVGSQHHPVPVEGSLLSPVTPQLQSPSRAIQTGLQNTQINPVPNNNYSAGAEQHGIGSSSTLRSNPPPANFIGTPGTSPPTHNLPPLPQKILQQITKRKYIDFADLLADNLSPHPSLTTQNQYKLEVNPQDPSALAIVPSQQRKRQVDGLHSWLEAWNIYLRTVLHHFPLLAPDLLAYQDQICKFSRKF